MKLPMPPLPKPNTRRSSLTAAALAAGMVLAMASLWPSTVRADSQNAPPPLREGGPLPASPLWHYQRCDPATQAQAFARIELFFGLSRPGSVVTEAEFQAFIDSQVTPRFPEGLTLLSGSGQFRSANGQLVREGTKLLVLLVPRRDRGASAKAEAIRVAYKGLFQQESVRRTDDTVCVSF